MTGRSLAPFTASESLTHRAPGSLERARPRPPLHAPTSMNDRTAPLRSVSWNALNPTVQAKLVTGAGRILEWFAQPDPVEDRPRAWLLGTHALAIGEPRRTPNGRRVYDVSFHRLDPTTFRTKQVTHRPGRRPRRGWLGGRGHSPSSETSAHVPGLEPGTAGVLGNLPPEAQDLLQSPFLTSPGLMRSTAYYEGTNEELTTVLVVLADRTTLTAAYGTRIIPPGHTEATAHWTLTCLRATTRPR